VTILAALAFGWVALALCAPWLPVPVAGAVYVFAAGICHQIGERSWYVGGVQLPVCARCLGIYVGAAVALPGLWRLDGERPYVRAVMMLALAMNAVTIALEWTNLWHVSNAMRAGAGAVLGAAIALAIRQVFGRPAHEARTVDYARCTSPRRITSALPESRI
jgi:uncharacterized membrane protein